MAQPSQRNAGAPRVLIASLRDALPLVPYASAVEFEDVGAAMFGAPIATRGLRAGRQDGPAARAADILRRRTGWGIAREPAPMPRPVTGGHDLFFLRMMSPSDADFLAAWPGWQDAARHRAVWVEEIWPTMLGYTKMLRALAGFDRIFVSNPAIAEPLSRIIGRPCRFLPQGVDALRFAPVPPAPRSTDFLSLGRRSEVTHGALLARATADPGFHYVFDTAQLREVRAPGGFAEHRFRTADQIRRARFFLADRAKIDAPEQTGGAHVFGPRYFEGAAGGALLVGEPPDCAVFRDLFDWPDAVQSMQYDCADPFAVLDAAAEDPSRVLAARKANVANMLLRHDWAYRWETILRAFDLPVPSELVARKAALAACADAVHAAERL